MGLVSSDGRVDQEMLARSRQHWGLDVQAAADALILLDIALAGGPEEQAQVSV
jgi:hypothetical protein